MKTKILSMVILVAIWLNGMAQNIERKTIILSSRIYNSAAMSKAFPMQKTINQLNFIHQIKFKLS